MPLMKAETIDPKVMKRAQLWLEGPFDEQTKREVAELIESSPAKLKDAFFQELSFGTGGMRGVMGVGTNRMNVYSIRAATQGLANYIKSQSEPEEGYSVFIGYDVRKNSKLFASNAARVLAANGIRVLLSSDICPTPLVSFGCRYFHCSAAIMITASHNPPEYNGYKVYWSDGGQIVPPHDEGIIREVRKVKEWGAIELAPENSPLITPIGQELDEAYLKEISRLQLYPELEKKDLKILYTPLHGTGIRIIPEALHRWGYDSLHLVQEQKNPDPQFANAPSPNPEEEKALEIGTRHLLQNKADLLIATDPDADRMGVVAIDRGAPLRLTGNQTACLCLFHICSALAARNLLPPNSAFVKTIVTTELFRAIAESFGAECIDVLTGFKYIGEKMTLWETSFEGKQYIFGAEESYGYLFGTHVRDKDAIISSCLIAEVAALAKKQNLTLGDRLHQIYQKYGVYRESIHSISYAEGAAGMGEMKQFMEQLRKSPPHSIGGQNVAKMEDYATGATGLPKSDVLRFWLEDGSKLVVRPSGTEPKVKIYAECFEKHPSSIDQAINRCDQRLQLMFNDIS